LRRFIVVVSVVCALATPGVMAGVASATDARAAQTIPLVVVKERNGATAALVRVFIHGQLVPMLVDTGATVSVINRTAARKLHLEMVGKPHRFCGVTGCALAGRVRVKNWNVGGVPLPTVVVSSSPIAGLNAHPFGLLGSDVLSRFGSVTIDYANKELILG
jgi:predicted aspartyl protease